MPDRCPTCGGEPPQTRGELTREQDDAANELAAKYGRCAVYGPLPSGVVVLTGLSDDIEREIRCVEPDGTVLDV